MSKSTPSLLALLGLVAVAGYQNRSKISEMMADARNEMPGSGQGQVADGGRLMANISQMFQSATGGRTLSEGLSELVERFKAAGKSAPAESWVADGPNMPMDVEDLERALGPETVDDLSQKSGLPRAQLLLRLNAALPEVVNRLTPNGRLPSVGEAQLMA